MPKSIAYPQYYLPKFFILICLVFLSIAFSASNAAAQTKLLRFPDIYGDKVVFTYGGDLWIAPSSGGTAIRLTAHPGVETFAKFSPDGKWIAFTGQYDGDEQVYVIPAGGGEPRQLTFYPARGPLAPRWGYDNQVLGWTNDGRIVFRSLRDSWTLPIARLYTVSYEGGPVEPLPMPEAGSGDISPDGKKIVYSPRSRDFRPEKRYSGGQANTLYIFDLATNDAEKISEGERASRDAMWIGENIYYNSDRDGKFNLYSYNTQSKKTTQITKNRDWDIRWPSSDNLSRIVYERDGELEVFDTNTKKAQKLNIYVPDDGVNKRKRQVSVANLISYYTLSPKGERAVFSARGDIFTVPAEKGAVRNLTKSSGAHDKYPVWSPNGRQIAFISDASGEEELWLVDQDGTSQPIQVTTGSRAQKYEPRWSPDNSKIAFSDKDGRLYVVTLATKQVQMIVDAANGLIMDYEWSPKGKFIAFSMQNPLGLSSVYIWSAETSKVQRITPEMFSANSPVWDTNGDYLYFIGTHEFAPQISQSEFNYATNRMNMIYAVTLSSDGKNPFPFESDEVSTADQAQSGASQPAASPQPSGNVPANGSAPPGQAGKTEKAEKIDFEGIERRVTRVPLGADNYVGLAAAKGSLLYIVQPPFYYGRPAESQSSLRVFSLKDRKEAVLQSPASGYTVSADGTKLMVASPGGQYFIMEANLNGERTKKQISTAGMVAIIDPVQEWNQIFNEVWRRYRDWFYVENMHGFNWEQIREEYKKWLVYVAHRSDLNYVISEMCSELTVQHAYIDGGDFNLPPRVRVALVGARFEADKASGRYRISKIFAGQQEEEIYRSPMSEVGVKANVGDYLLQVNGEEVKTDRDVYAYFRGIADSPVTLTLNSSPTLEGARKVTIRPVTNETDLIYMDWVEANRRRVDQLSNGRVGYLHIPDMGAAGIREFIKWYYPQLKKEGLIVDVRANGGGNVSRMIIERLRRKVLGINYSRTNQDGTTYPDGTFMGPMVAILNENSASDGDIFPYMFRAAGIGPLIGKRSWGGVVGITNRGNLIDGGVVNVPEFALANPQGQYIIEGHGVDPDIEVDNDPKSVIAGRDPQLERAVEEVMKKLTQPVKLPKKPAEPVKTGNK
ncbi:MAG TPA: S41 family peptidase [Pyrinomonadaceae bacterium]|nr:S41 family peptidase [Pyrinomonadaceae bacterium]